MKIYKVFPVLFSGVMALFAAEPGFITGVITDASNKPVKGAIVRLEKANISDITGDDGTFSIKYAATSVRKENRISSSFNISLNNQRLYVKLKSPEAAKIDLFDIRGRFAGTLFNGMMNEGINRINVSLQLASKTYILHCRIGNDIANYKIDAGSDKITVISRSSSGTANSPRNILSAAATLQNTSDVEMVEVTHNSFTTQKVLINPLVDQSVLVSLSKSKANWIVELEKLYADQTVYADGLQMGGYMVLGSTHSTAGDYDIGIVNLDQFGSVVSKKVYGGSDNDLAFEFSSHTDGDVRLFGSIWYRDDANKNDLMTMHLAQNGDSISTVVAKTDDNIVYGRGTVTPDGGSIITGYKIKTDSTTHRTHYSAVIVRFNALDNVMWKKEFDNHQYNYANDIITLKNGGFIFMGSCVESVDSDIKIWLLKLDENGNVLKESVLTGTKDAFASQIIETDDNKLFLLGRTQYREMDRSYLARLSSDCTVEWDSVVVDSTRKINCMTKIADGSIVLACSKLPDRKSSFEFEFEGINLINITTDGTLIRELNISENHGHAESISLGKDKSFIIATAQGYTLDEQKFFVLNVTW
jgi:hypothetical protein